MDNSCRLNSGAPPPPHLTSPPPAPRASACPPALLTAAELQQLLPEQAAGPALAVLEAVGLCTRVGEAAWEFPALAAPDAEGQGGGGGGGEGAAWGGVLLRTTAPGPLLAPMFPRVQAQLRRSLRRRLAGECGVEQGGGSSSLTCGPLHGEVSLGGDTVQVGTATQHHTDRTGPWGRSHGHMEHESKQSSCILRPPVSSVSFSTQ